MKIDELGIQCPKINHNGSNHNHEQQLKVVLADVSSHDKSKAPHRKSSAFHKSIASNTYYNLDPPILL